MKTTTNAERTDLELWVLGRACLQYKIDLIFPFKRYILREGISARVQYLEGQPTANGYGHLVSGAGAAFE